MQGENNMTNRPHSREKGSSSSSADVFKRGDGLSTGPVGNADYSQRPSGPSHLSGGSSSSGGGPRGSYGSGGSGGGLLKLIIIGAIVLFGGGSLSGLFGGSSGSTSTYTDTGSSSSGSTGTYSNPLAAYQSQQTYADTSTAEVNTSVASGARDKYTKLIGNGSDKVTVMVYMCGTDLESNYGMATSDLNEMAYATHSDKVNIIVETGGAKQWQNSVISSKTNQLWKVADKGLLSLNKNMGSMQMTDPSTLQSFIQTCAKDYPADRYMLILWDHGGGSVQGYGYDELYPNGTMTINKIASALKNGGVKFDFVGFDACLMANMETAVAVQPYADYLIASEETEPGTGWYYTDWLSTLAKNTSTPTTDLGKQIIDTFISASAKNSSSDQTSLSLTDLAEFAGTVPDKLKAFSQNVTSLVKSDQAQTVADARSNTKEFARSNSLDQVDLVNFCENLNTDQGKALAKAIQGCVKYNRVNNMKNAYGLSVYFPYANTKYMSKMSEIYNDIDMDSSYSDAMRSFATLAASGQVGTSSQSSSIFDILGGSSSSSGNYTSAEDILNQFTGGSSSSSSSSGVSDLLGTLLGGSSSGVDSGSLSQYASFFGKNHVDTGSLVLTEKDGGKVLALSDDQWKLIHTIELNVWADDGTGYLDLGLDNVFDFDSDGDLKMDYDGTWLALNGQPVAYYLTSDEYYEDGTYRIDGYIPAMLNGQRVNILVEFTDQNKDGTVLGAQAVYDSATEGKGLITIQDGDQIDFLCDYYDYSGNYSDTYYLGDQMTVSNGLTLSTVTLTGTSLSYCYRLTDLYDAHTWTPVISYSSN